MMSLFWDSMLFIYLIEKNPTLYDKVIALWDDICKKKETPLITSVFTLGEVLVKPFKEKKNDLVVSYRSLLLGNPERIRLVKIDEKVAEKYAEIRAMYPRGKVKPPDALQLACAASYGVEAFVTNDDRLVGISISGIERIVSLDKEGLYRGLWNAE